jgi:predicted dehydrogenase
MPPVIGVVGLGTMGTNHAARLVDAGASVVGTDVDSGARAAFTERFGVRTYENYTEMYDAGLDGVVITVPNAFHEGLTVDALARDIHVLVEKPLAHTLESAERIATAANAADAFCTVGLVMRYYPVVAELRARVERGDLGTVRHVETRYVRSDGAPKRGWFIDPDLAGGGALIDVGVHVLDLGLAVLGFPEVQGLYGCTRSERDELAVEDSASGLVRFADGRSLGLEVSWAANCAAEQSIVVRGDGGGAYLDIETQTLQLFAEDRAEPVPVPTGTSDWLAPEDEAFLHAVKRGSPPDEGTIDQAITVQRIVDGVYQSAASGDARHP